MVGAPGRGLLRADEQLPVKLQMGSLQRPLQPGTVLRFGSLEFMSLDGSYDMILFPPPGGSDNGGRQPARRRRNRRRLPRVVEAFELTPSSLPPMEEEAGQPRPSRRQRLVGCERVDSASTSTGGALGIDLALETKTSTISPRHAYPERTDDASTLTEGLLGVTLVPETTVQLVPDVTSSPLVDQEVPTDSHPTSFGFSLNPPSGFALAGALVEASPNPLGPADGHLDLRTLWVRGRRRAQLLLGFLWTWQPQCHAGLHDRMRLLPFRLFRR
jgi:hypothetical protein